MWTKEQLQERIDNASAQEQKHLDAIKSLSNQIEAHRANANACVGARQAYGGMLAEIIQAEEAAEKAAAYPKPGPRRHSQLEEAVKCETVAG